MKRTAWSYFVDSAVVLGGHRQSGDPFPPKEKERTWTTSIVL